MPVFIVLCSVFCVCTKHDDDDDDDDDDDEKSLLWRAAGSRSLVSRTKSAKPKFRC